MLKELSGAHERDSRSVDPRFEEHRPATFVLFHLIRLLVSELKGYTFTLNDSLDFCHAVLAAAYGSIATLDKQWKRRIEALPAEDGMLAKIYSAPELDEFVSLLESMRAR
jgi:hypothetical protein